MQAQQGLLAPRDLRVSKSPKSPSPKSQVFIYIRYIYMFPGSHTSKYKTRCMQGDEADADAEAGAKAADEWGIRTMVLVNMKQTP